MLASAIGFAAIVHAAQRDKGGKAYILHPLRVMFRVGTDDEELAAIAVLHDSIEDSDHTVESLLDKGFSSRIIAALDLLTHKDGQSYDEYIRLIATNHDALRVKLADLEENTCVTRLKGITEKDFARMQKYHKAYTYLKSVKQISGVINKIE